MHAIQFGQKCDKKILIVRQYMKDFLSLVPWFKESGEKTADAEGVFQQNPVRPPEEGGSGGGTTMGPSLPKELLRAEILDWWEEEQERVSHELSRRLQTVLDQVDAEVDNISLKNLFVYRGRFVRETIEPFVVAFLEGNYREFSEKMKESFESSMAQVEAGKFGIEVEEASYWEWATAGGTMLASVAPLASLPFLTGGVLTGGVTVLGFTLVAPVVSIVAVGAMATAGLGILVIGQPMRQQAFESQRRTLKSEIRSKVKIRVIGDPTKPDIGSLKGTLLNELRNVTWHRLEAIE